MRYRRYYTGNNRDGSTTVVSTGPVWAIWVGFGKFWLYFMFWSWPFAVILYNLPGAPGWVLGVLAEIVWLFVVSRVVRLIKEQMSSKP